MSELVSPKQVAQAIGVSESSLKRWCDQGLIETVRTAGGHRRLAVSSVMGYLQKSGHRLIAPEVLGLPPLTVGAGQRSLSKAQTALIEALTQGQDLASRQIVVEAFLAGHPMHAIADELVAPAFHEIGRQWGCGEVAVYQERHACEIMARVLADLRRMTERPPSESVKAIGGTLECDYYSLPNQLVELVLRNVGWDAVSLGCNLPADSMVIAIQQQRPRLVWLSVSHYECEEKFVSAVESIRAAAFAIRAPFVIGGRMMCESLRQKVGEIACCDSMVQLDAYAHALLQTQPN
ncbi:MAG: MerR family DNA-binding transcriptional regulator [Planctomycetota bacterium]|nr:MAG: MerR family DNA-binding transcriptional regulator [Planctomycetota bacterium]